MAIAINEPGQYKLMTPTLPPGPVTEAEWRKMRTGYGLLVVSRRTGDAPVVSVTFTMQIAGKLRRLRVLPRLAHA